jgi:catechol 2,3-dioxygenase-like lactoylglutathione lyase family enzyme
MPVHRIFHVNINCTDLVRSRAFYVLVGFKVRLDTGDRPGGPDRAGVGMAPDSLNRVVMLALDDGGEAGTLIDLMQWVNPLPHGEPTHRGPGSDLAHIGIARIALMTTELDTEYARLRDAGVEFLSPPVTMADGATRYCCFFDPDGAVLELVEFGTA